jgi:hypothetical protein
MPTRSLLRSPCGLPQAKNFTNFPHLDGLHANRFRLLEFRDGDGEPRLRSAERSWNASLPLQALAAEREAMRLRTGEVNAPLFVRPVTIDGRRDSELEVRSQLDLKFAI